MRNTALQRGQEEQSAGAAASSGVAPTPENSALPLVEGGKPARAGRLYVLDLLRFVAAMAVLMWHYVANDEGVWAANTADLFSFPVQQASRYGWLGVECFFVISGFVICMSSWGRSISAFFTSRVTRLMPAYIVAVLLASCALWLAPFNGQRPEPTHVLYNLTLLNSYLKIPNVDVVYWTLFTELNFYILFAIVVHFGVTYRRVVLFCILWTTFALIALQIEAWPVLTMLQPYWVSYFVAGITLYLIYRFGPNLLLWAMLGTTYIISLFWLQKRVEGFKDPLITFPAAAAITFAFFAVMTAVALRRFDWIRWRGLVLIGALTYPVYLLHGVLGRVAIKQLHGSMPPILLLCLVIAGVLLLSYLVHRFVERPGSAYLRRGLRASFDKIRAADQDAREPHELPAANGGRLPASDGARLTVAEPAPVPAQSGHVADHATNGGR